MQKSVTPGLPETPPGEWHEVYNSRLPGNVQLNCLLFVYRLFFFSKQKRSYIEIFRGRDSDLCNFPTCGGKSRCAPKCITQPLIVHHMHGKDVWRPFGKPVPIYVERNSNHSTSPQQTEQLHGLHSPETCTMHRGSSVQRSVQLNFSCTLGCQVETYSKEATISDFNRMHVHRRVEIFVYRYT